MTNLDDIYVVRECRSGAFWGPKRGGYSDLAQAGVYSRDEALSIQASSDRTGDRRDRAMSLREAIETICGWPPRTGTVLAAMIDANGEAR